LIHTPKILFLDEPTNGVDPISRRDFWKILYELKRDQVTIVVSSTYLDEVDRCHRVALFDRGRVRLVMEPLAMRGLMRGTLFSLTCSNRQQALKVLKTLPQVQNPSIFGTGIHFTLIQSSDLALVNASLTQAGLIEVRIEETIPGLEDVYLALMEKDGEQGFKDSRGPGVEG
jgi:ABC-2 type transport system ATP-binding protein